MNLYKEQILKHGVEWRKHKYIRKEGNRYIYPEDIPKNDIQRHHAEVLADRRQAKETAKKDAAFLKRKGQIEDPLNRLYDVHPASSSASNFIKSHQQIQKAHQNSTWANLQDPTRSSYGYRDAEKNYNDRMAARKKGQEFDQINSAHQRATSLTSRNKDDKTLTRRNAIPEIGQREADILRNRKNYGSDIESRKRKEEETRKRRIKTNQQITNAHQGSTHTAEYWNAQGNNHYATGGSRGSTGYSHRIADAELGKAIVSANRDKKNREKAAETVARTDATIERMRKKRRKPKVSKEYQQELAYNSRKNRY